MVYCNHNVVIILYLHCINFSSRWCFSQKCRDFPPICLFKLASTTCILVIMTAMLFLQFTLHSSSFFSIPSKATLGVALEVEQPGIAQLSPGISNIITELIAMRNLTSVRFYSVWFSREKFVYIYCMLKKTGSSFLRYTSYLTKTARSARFSRLSLRFSLLWFFLPQKFYVLSKNIETKGNSVPKLLNRVFL